MTDYAPFESVEEYIDYAEGIIYNYVEDYGPVDGYALETVFPERYTDVPMVEIVCGSDEDAEGLAMYLEGQRYIEYVHLDRFVVSVEMNF